MKINGIDNNQANSTQAVTNTI